MPKILKDDKILEFFIVEKSNYISSRFSIWEFCLILILLHNLVPIVGYLMPTAIYGILIGLYFVFLANKIGSDHFFNVIGRFFPLLFLSILNCVLNLINHQHTIILDLYGMVQLLVLPTAAYVILQERNCTAAKRIIAVSLIAIVITCVTTIYGNIKILGASRLLAGTAVRESVEFGTFKMMNIGGFSFAYYLVLITPLPIIVIKRKNQKNKILWFALLTLIAITLIFEDYTTALSLYFVSSFFLFLPLKISSRRLFFIIIILVLMFEVLSPLLLNTIQFFSSEQGATSEKIDDLLVFMDGGEDFLDSQSDIYARNKAFTKSWQLFLNNPLGTWSRAKIGGHSLFLDSLAKFGCLALLVFIAIYKCVYKNFFKPFKENIWFGYILWICILSFILTILNTHLFWLVLVFFIPLSGILLEQNNS